MTTAFVVIACGGSDDDTERARPADRGPGTTVVYAVGDGADGEEPAAELADYIAEQDPDRFFYLGDVYERGTPREFRRHYDALYGRLIDRTDPTIGNHEYLLRVFGYYRYWALKRGWSREVAKHRSYVDERSGWQVISYSSETSEINAEARWVTGEIEKHRGTCRIAMGHKGRHVVADSHHSDNREQEPIWKALKGTTAINLIGHEHIYGRLEPIDGVHVIVSGAGGHDLRDLGRQHHQVAASAVHTPTATRLVLRRGRAELTQVDADGRGARQHDDLLHPRGRGRVVDQRRTARQVAARLPDPRLIAIVAGVAIVILGIAGTIVGTGATPGKGPHSHSPFHLINEKTIPAFFSAVLLGLGAVAAYMAGLLRVRGEHAAWFGFALLLLVMSADEVAQLHEKAEKYSDIDWQTVYVPVFAGAAWVWWRLVKAVEGIPRALLFGGAVAWGISQVLELVQYGDNDVRVAAFAPMAISEEILEMAGSTMFLLAAVILLGELVKAPG